MTNQDSDSPSRPVPRSRLLQRAQDVVSLAERVRDAQKVASEADRFYERRDQIDELLGRLLPLVLAQRLMSEAGIAFTGAPRGRQIYETTSEDLIKIKEAFEIDPSSIFKSAFKTVRERADKIAIGLRKRLLDGWTDFVDGIVPRHDPEQLDVFEKVPTFKTVVRQLRALSGERAQLLASLPSSEADLREPEKLALRMEEAWAKLGGGAPREIRELVRAAGSRAGAPLEALTDDAREWLSERGALDAFRIRIQT